MISLVSGRQIGVPHRGYCTSLRLKPVVCFLLLYKISISWMVMRFYFLLAWYFRYVQTKNNHDHSFFNNNQQRQQTQSVQSTIVIAFNYSKVAFIWILWSLLGLLDLLQKTKKRYPPSLLGDRVFPMSSRRDMVVRILSHSLAGWVAGNQKLY